MRQRSVSRQRKWQIEQMKAGLCKLCPEPRGPGDSTFCPAHREAYRDHMRSYMQKRRTRTVVVV